MGLILEFDEMYEKIKPFIKKRAELEQKKINEAKA
jgi:hypothetical protein